MVNMLLPGHDSVTTSVSAETLLVLTLTHLAASEQPDCRWAWGTGLSWAWAGTGAGPEAPGLKNGFEHGLKNGFRHVAGLGRHPVVCNRGVDILQRIRHEQLST